MNLAEREDKSRLASNGCAIFSLPIRFPKAIRCLRGCSPRINCFHARRDTYVHIFDFTEAAMPCGVLHSDFHTLAASLVCKLYDA